MSGGSGLRPRSVAAPASAHGGAGTSPRAAQRPPPVARRHHGGGHGVLAGRFRGQNGRIRPETGSFSGAFFLFFNGLSWSDPYRCNDRKGLERLLRYCARPPFAADRLEELDPQRLLYRLPKPGPDGRTQIILSPLALIGRIAALVPPPRQHRHRYYGVLAPNYRCAPPSPLWHPRPWPPRRHPTGR